MADLEKNILVVIPVNEDHKKFLEEKAASGNKNCCVRYVNGSDVTAEDVKEANVIIGNVDPALVKEAKNLELFQLNSAGTGGARKCDGCLRACRIGTYAGADF